MGMLSIPKDGVYTFYTVSDDGSRLYIGENLVVDNDNLHGAMEKEGTVPLKEGYHPIRVEFFQREGSDSLGIFFSGPDIEKQSIPPGQIFFHK